VVLGLPVLKNANFSTNNPVVCVFYMTANKQFHTIVMSLSDPLQSFVFVIGASTDTASKLKKNT
jgi:hypothetical protein